MAMATIIESVGPTNVTEYALCALVFEIRAQQSTMKSMSSYIVALEGVKGEQTDRIASLEKEIKQLGDKVAEFSGTAARLTIMNDGLQRKIKELGGES